MLLGSPMSVGMLGSGRAEARWQHLTVRNKVGIITIMGSKPIGNKQDPQRSAVMVVNHGLPRSETDEQSVKVLINLHF